PLAAQASSPPPVAAPAVATGSGTASAGASTAPAAAAAAASAGASAAPVGAQSPPVAPPPLSAPPLSVRRLSAPPVVAPAGVGAPPLSDATRVVPLAEPGEDREEPASVLGEREALAGDGMGTTSPQIAGTTPSPVTAAAGGNGFSATAGAPGAPRPLLEDGLPTHTRVPRWVIAVVAVVLAAVIAGVLVLALRPGSSPQKTNAGVHHHHAVAVAAAPPGVTPSVVTVAVVNATNINQLAHHVSTHLTAAHFQPGTLATATNQPHAKTMVGYLLGHRNDALAVAHTLKLPASAVRPVPQSSEALVCPNPSDCTADVIVVAGSDLAPKR
ncbi:MAG: LytR C-terminal domain-containing protein, partial [Solirubrobacteraceae bacterium]